jgi:hypothetical protein
MADLMRFATRIPPPRNRLHAICVTIALLYASHRIATGTSAMEWINGSYEIGNCSCLNLLLGICRRYHDMSPHIAWRPCAEAMLRVKGRQDRRQARGLVEALTGSGSR